MGNRQSALSRQIGFTLLETLVALSVLAISLGVIYQIFGTSLRNMEYAKNYSTAQMLAESKLSELGKGIPVVEGAIEGEVGSKYRWHVDMLPLSSPEEDETVRKMRIDFKIFWEENNKERVINVRTYRLSVQGF